MRLPGCTPIAPAASALELFGLDATNADRYVASMWLYRTSNVQSPIRVAPFASRPWRRERPTF
jgi:hypothetical protein